MERNSFLPADILLPKVEDYRKWSVIACDQFTSQPSYWERVRENAGDAPSTIRLILPEAELGGPKEAEAVDEINRTMTQYLEQGLFECHPNSFVYVERVLMNGQIRQGLVGMVDLEAYDYSPGSTSPIRATEKTVVERIPPRMRVRRNAPIELPHILLLCDDHDKTLIEPIAGRKGEKLYDFYLMEDGGRVTGWLVDGAEAEAFENRLSEYTAALSEKYEGLPGTPPVFAVGDGNHSLATAKACYEELKAAHPDEDLSKHPARYALVELENIHSPAQTFTPIHRIISKTDPKALLAALEAEVCADGGFPVEWRIGEESGVVHLDRARGQLAVGVLQGWLDGWLKEHSGEIDYIHGEGELRTLAAKPDSIGFLLPAMDKSELFRGIMADGVLPRKTFSMGSAREKRYYLEGRRIQ